MVKSYTWGHSMNHSVIYSWRVWMPTNLGLENQLDSIQNSSYFSSSFRHWDCTANGWELRGLNLQFNIQYRLAIFSKFESAAADKWPEVTRRMTRRITWSWSPRPGPAPPKYITCCCRYSNSALRNGMGLARD